MNTIKAWKNPAYRSKLKREELSQLPSNPAGSTLAELDESETKDILGGGTANSYCSCVSGEHSCGTVCTATAECPILTIICC